VETETVKATGSGTVNLPSENFNSSDPLISHDLLAAAASIHSVDDFKQWTKDYIRPMLPHESLLCGLGHLHAGGVSLNYLVGVDYPIGHIAAIRNRVGAIDTPILRRWLTVREPLIFESDRPWPDIPEKWLNSFRHYDLRNIVVHAVADAERCVGTYHSFYRIPGTPGMRHIEVLRRLTPLLHRVVCTVIENLDAKSLNVETRFTASLAALTEREREVLHWLMLGKTNGEIARLAAISENTVKHHLTHSFGKLHVENRAQLVRCLAEHKARLTPGQGTKVL
jgi:DNA-binding CsgD family transcriptional regulator